MEIKKTNKQKEKIKIMNETVENNYRLEFNEEQQNFHFDNNYHKPNTFGWVTIMDSCSDIDYKIFDAYVNRVKINKLTTKYLLKCVLDIKAIHNLKNVVTNKK
jgi:hypothetical protein